MTDQPTFLHLSAAEMAALQDRDFLPLKHRVSAKIDAALLHLRDLILPQLRASSLPPVLRDTPPKLSRGENYRQYAYRVLDCPRHFAGGDMLAFRSMVLWGHPVGFHLMLAGRYRRQYLPALLAHYSALPPGAWLARQETPWVWEAGAAGLLPLDQLSPAEVAEALDHCDYVKISYFLPLSAYSQLPAQGLAYWQAWQDLLTRPLP